MEILKNCNNIFGKGKTAPTMAIDQSWNVKQPTKQCLTKNQSKTQESFV